MSGSYKILKLPDIARWEIENIDKDWLSLNKQIIGGIPSFQRGLVWKSNQVEYLWDSIFRGFPIGSIIASERLENQKTQQRGDSNSNETTHHIIDGQQRSHNIALAFYDQYSDLQSGVEKNKIKNRSYLWIDLAFSKKKHTRNFLIRLITPAHPWGYKSNNESSRLNTSDIVDHRKVLGKLNKKDKLYAYESFPADAKFPVPTITLIKFYMKYRLEENTLFNSDNFFNFIEINLSSIPACLKKELHDSDTKEIVKSNWIQIMKGLRNAFESSQIPFLIIPALNESATDEMEIEVLFQRLNRLGTPLGGMELTYSLIKAVWSGIEVFIEESAELASMHPAHMAIQSFRVLYQDQEELLNKEEITLVSEPNVKSIRGKKENTEFAERVRQYIETDELKNNVKRVNTLVGSTGFLIPDALISYLSKNSRDVYFWLLWFAHKYPDAFENEEMKKRLLGVVTALDIFGIDKEWAIKYLYKNVSDDADSFRGVLYQLYKLGNNKKGLEILYTPEELEILFSFDNLKENENDEASKSKRKSLYDYLDITIKEKKLDRSIDDTWSFVNKLQRSRKLLIYAQKEYFFEEKFNEYDAMSSYWTDHNRPWDYDHILPGSTLYGKYHKEYPYKRFLDQWINTIGNLRLLSFSENRGRGNNQLNCNTIELRVKKLFLIHEDCRGFDQVTTDFEEKNSKAFENTKRFAESSSRRMIKIYKHWWEQLDISYLVDEVKL